MADNVLTYKGNGIIQIMSTGELNALSQAVLEYMATNDGPGGIYTSNVGNASFSLIGTFTDTRFTGNIGEGDVTILSSQYNLYQDLTTPTGTEPPSPLRYGSTSEPIRAMTTVQLEDLANTILQYGLNNEGPHSYVLQSTAPVDGGTWTSLGTLKDIYSGGIESPKNLYKKLTSGSYTLNRPLKSIGNGTIQAFTTAEINYLAKKVRERIVNTGIGQYRFQATAPTPGTWVEKGSIIDTRATEITDVQYSTTYVGAEIPYTTDVNYTLETPTVYSGLYYTGDVEYQLVTPTTYDGGFYTGPDNSYTLDTPTAYVGSDFTSSVYYTLDTPTTFGGPAYTSDVATNYTGVTPNESFNGPAYTLVTTQNYLGAVFTTFTGTGPALYTGSYVGTTFTGYTSTVDVTYNASYTSTPNAYYTLVTPIEYIDFGTYVGGVYAGTYTGSYTNIYYTSSYQTFVPQAGFWTFYDDSGSSTYTNFGATSNFSIFASPSEFYTGGVQLTYTRGPTYTGIAPGVPDVVPYENSTFTSLYTGVGFGSYYSGPVIGVPPPAFNEYQGSLTMGFAAPFPAVGVFYVGATNFVTYTKDAIFYSSPTPGSLSYLGEILFNTYGSPVFESYYAVTYNLVGYYTGSTIDTYTNVGSFALFGAVQYTNTNTAVYLAVDPTPGYFSTFFQPTFAGFAPVDYTGVTPSDYTGPGSSVFYTVTYSGERYTGVVPGGYFNVLYTGTTLTPYTLTNQYTADYTGIATSTFNQPTYYLASFDGTVVSNYTLSTPYASKYTSIVTNTFTGSVVYTGAAGQYDTVYTGSSISDTPVTVSTIKLWRRIA